jgi:hypothetical protein
MRDEISNGTFFEGRVVRCDSGRLATERAAGGDDRVGQRFWWNHWLIRLGLKEDGGSASLAILNPCPSKTTTFNAGQGFRMLRIQV